MTLYLEIFFGKYLNIFAIEKSKKLHMYSTEIYKKILSILQFLEVFVLFFWIKTHMSTRNILINLKLQEWVLESLFPRYEFVKLEWY